MTTNSYYRELDEDQDDTKETVPISPTAQTNVHLDSFDATPMHSLMKPSELVTPFGQRKYKFVVHSTFNTLPTVHEIEKKNGEEDSEDDVIKRIQPVKSCSLEVHSSKPAPGCRYMYDMIEDKVL